MSSQLLYRSYAKINLYLDVLKRRRDGYHNIETIFQTVDLCDELSFAEEPHRIAITCSTPDLDTGEGNLVYKAAALLRGKYAVRQGARIHLEKHIPIAAGLAGGSGNAAAALIALNVLWDLRLPAEILRAHALELGSDVPYCTLGGAALATGRGEQLAPLPPLKSGWFVLLHPPIAVSAARTYNHELMTRNEETAFAGRTRSFRRALRHHARGDFAQLVFNRMETPVFHDFPHLAEAKHRLLEAGCTAAAMSGSGSTLFGVCAAKRDAGRVAEQFPEFRTSVVKPVPVGVERIR